MALLVTLLLLAGVAAPLQEPDNHAHATLHTRARGDDVQIAIAVRIDEHWHLYHGPTREDLGSAGATGLPTTVEFEPAEFEYSAIRIAETPKATTQDDGDGPQTVREHVGSITIHALARARSAGADRAAIVAHVRGLTCGDSGTCVPYAEDVSSAGSGPDALFARFPADLRPGAPAAVPPGSAAPSGAPPRDASNDAAVTFPDYAPRSDAAAHGLGAWLLLAFVAGLLLNVMPCVLPVVSIKILSFVQQAGESRARVFGLGLAFAAGILAVFVVLAALAAFAGKGWGEQFQDPRFLVVMIAVVFAFALSMLDVFELGVPSAIGSASIAQGSRRAGAGDAFAKGALATVLATPCSGPFLGSTLAWSVTQSVPTVFLVFLTIGLGMAAPYVVLTASPRALRLVPRPGSWMQTFKHLMGFVLLATVVYLMTSLRQDLLLFTVAFLVFVAAACWAWGRFATLEQKPLARAGTALVVLAIVALGARVAFVDLRGLFAERGSRLAWVEFDPALLASSSAAGRNVFVDFTASWCPNCKYNEYRVFESAEFAELVRDKDVLAMRADITHDGPRTDMIRRLMAELGSRSIPLCAVFPGDRPIEPYVRPDIVTLAGMRSVLEACPDPPRR